jgi:dipeptidyl aminopeptidase/acylaminoacyl peptidase
MDGSQEWNVSFKRTYIAAYKSDDPQATDLLQTAFIPAGWTGDEKYLYLAVQSGPADAPFVYFDALFRLDLTTGRLTPTLKPAVGTLRTSYAFQFSPGGTQLAYVNQTVRPLSIVLYNTGTGAENRITLDARFSQAGSFLWSPDEKQLLVSAQDMGANGGNSVILFDLATMKDQYLVQNSPIVYLPLGWVGDTSIYAERYPDQWVSLDTHSRAITPAASPTPLP